MEAKARQKTPRSKYKKSRPDGSNTFSATGSKHANTALGTQAGFDLIQIAIVIGVIGILMAGAFIGVPAVMASVRATGDAQDIQSYVSKQQAYPENSAEISNASVIANNLYNVEMVVNDDELRNRFGGSVDINGAESTAAFEILSKEVPRRACVKLVPILAPLFDAVDVGGNVVKDARLDPAVIPTQKDITAACTNADGVVDILYSGVR